ncbi:MAG: hypothetical protein GEU79_16955 [Acidimicrobiia bacterium]|nr:hypothetical protein [Acidimicrobiia bacterium]
MLLYAGRPNWDLLATVIPVEIRSAVYVTVLIDGETGEGLGVIRRRDARALFGFLRLRDNAGAGE